MCLIFQQKIIGFKEELTNTKVHEFIVKSITDIQGNHGRISKTRPIYHLTKVLHWNLSLVTKASKTARRLAKTTVVSTVQITFLAAKTSFMTFPGINRPRDESDSLKIHATMPRQQHAFESQVPDI